MSGIWQVLRGPGLPGSYFLTILYNGVNLRNGAAALWDIFEDQCQIEIDLAGLGEIHMDTMQFGVKQKCYNALQKSFEYGKMVLNSSLITSKNEYKLGGRMFVHQDDVVGCMVATRDDGMGRWSWTKLSGSGSKRINSSWYIKFAPGPQTKQALPLITGKKTLYVWSTKTIDAHKSISRRISFSS
jgi:hypothetical protein